MPATDLKHLWYVYGRRADGVADMRCVWGLTPDDARCAALLDSPIVTIERVTPLASLTP